MLTNNTSGVTAEWVPSVDINEFDDRLQIFVDVPGVDPEDVEITLDADNVKATDRHGVLEISIFKQAKAQPRRIKVAA